MPLPGRPGCTWANGLIRHALHPEFEVERASINQTRLTTTAQQACSVQEVEQCQQRCYKRGNISHRRSVENFIDAFSLLMTNDSSFDNQLLGAITRVELNRKRNKLEQ